jgi:hypothetical protein
MGRAPAHTSDSDDLIPGLHWRSRVDGLAIAIPRARYNIIPLDGEIAPFAKKRVERAVEQLAQQHMQKRAAATKTADSPSQPPSNTPSPRARPEGVVEVDRRVHRKLTGLRP